MQPRPDSDTPHLHRDAKEQLPVELAMSLAPIPRRALMHGMRRRILRALTQDPTPQTIEDLLPTFPGATLSAVNYHVLVLGDCGSLTVSRVEQTHGGFARSFVSNVADNLEFVAALQATEQLDGAG